MDVNKSTNVTLYCVICQFSHWHSFFYTCILSSYLRLLTKFMAFLNLSGCASRRPFVLVSDSFLCCFTYL